MKVPPKQANSKPEILDCCGSVVIIGANGAGKSKFGVWIEQNQLNSEKVHRISAQKSLYFPEYVPLKGLEEAEKELLFGTSDSSLLKSNFPIAKMMSRWSNAGLSDDSAIRDGLNDSEKALTLLFARKAQRDSQVVKLLKKREREGKNETVKIPKSPDDILLEIWKDLLPHRELVIEDNKINVLTSGKTIYHGGKMSDGERIAFYLMAQCLCVPSDSIVIIDEPEIHLHKSLMSQLWSRIEEAQPGCLFVYITHDIDFAASRVGAKKLWLKSYDGKHWNWGEVPETEGLPEPILLEILGSRKKILFVESNIGGLDYKVYEAVYPEFLIMPCGGCEKVIEATKAMRGNSALYPDVEAFGIIDMDYRPQNQIDSLRTFNIFALNVAEIENIFCVPELLEVVANHLNFDNSSDICQRIANFVINKLEQDLQNQVAKRSASEIQFKLNKFNEKESKDKFSLEKTFDNLVTSINANEIYEKNLDLYKNIILSKDYKKALIVYHQKNLHTLISPFFDLKSNGYLKLILRLLSSERKNDIVSALKKYTPPL
ncbi:AAA family ATPase [Microcoleus sp. Pol12A5]|uniref:AAA family ATPase n=1 Tax=Microcoleus sp. Pol12A5 TaxID=3055392 RepID=UPI002FCF6DF5